MWNMGEGDATRPRYSQPEQILSVILKYARSIDRSYPSIRYMEYSYASNRPAPHNEHSDTELPDAPETMDDYTRACGIYGEGEYNSVEELFRKVLTSTVKLFGKEHRQPLLTMHYLSRALIAWASGRC